jgi:AmmeMemoRadiSam system protein B
MHARGIRDIDGRLASAERLARFAARLDDNLLLDGPRFRQIVDAPVRPPRCIGCYEGDPDLLRRQLTGLFTNPRGPGLPGAPRAKGGLRAALIPHIDYPRGGVTYAWGFKEVVEQTDASLFVIIGTSHYSAHRFTLTRKDFETPLGITRADQGYIDRLVHHYGPGLFDDEWLAHLPEHSIELEVVFLQYLYEKIRPIRIVPLVVGSFFDCVIQRSAPTRHADIAAMVEALRRAEAETPEPICYIISGDLAHIGLKFDDPIPLTPNRLAQSRQQDFAILRQAESANPAGYFKVIADEEDARNICGLPPTFTLLEAIRPGSGKLLHYDQYAHPRGQESVSFASMAFYGTSR